MPPAARAAPAASPLRLDALLGLADDDAAEALAALVGAALEALARELGPPSCYPANAAEGALGRLVAAARWRRARRPWAEAIRTDA